MNPNYETAHYPCRGPMVCGFTLGVKVESVNPLLSEMITGIKVSDTLFSKDNIGMDGLTSFGRCTIIPPGSTA